MLTFITSTGHRFSFHNEVLSPPKERVTDSHPRNKQHVVVVIIVDMVMLLVMAVDVVPILVVCVLLRDVIVNMVLVLVMTGNLVLMLDVNMRTRFAVITSIIQS